MADARGRRRSAPAAPPLLAALAALLVLTGCASLPTSGPVLAGAAAGEPREYRVAPVGPSYGASPVETAEGFLRAAVGAPDDFAAARSFLVTDRQRSWRPGARVVVHAGSELLGFALSQGGTALPWDPAADPDPAAGPLDVEVTAPVVATLDDRGTYRPAAPGAVERMRLRLVAQDGQWRIEEVPDQLLLDPSDFRLGWRARSLYFPAPDGSRLVPEVRWFADRVSTPTTAVVELLRGPSAWLAPATRPPGVPLTLASGTVPVQDGIAEVDLDASVLAADARTRALLRRQLEATLLPLPSVSSVLVTAEGGVLSDAPSGPAAAAEVPVDTPPVVLSAGAPARWSGGRLRPLRGLAATTAGPLDAVGVRDDAVAALAAGRTALVRWEVPAGGGEDAAPAEPAVVLGAPAGSTLTPPSLDPAGWTWSTAAASDGTVTAVGRDGAVAVVGAPWLAGRTVFSLRASREGARVLVASTAPDGSDPRVDVAGLVRTADGAPVALAVADGAPTPWLGSVRAAVWVDSSTVAVLGAAVPGSAPAGSAAGTTTQVLLVEGGEVTALGAPLASAGAAAPELVGLAAGTGARSLLLAASDAGGAQVFERAGARWVAIEELAGSAAPAYAG